MTTETTNTTLATANGPVATPSPDHTITPSIFTLMIHAGKLPPGEHSLTELRAELGWASATAVKIRRALRDPDHPLTHGLAERGVRYGERAWGKPRAYLCKAGVTWKTVSGKPRSTVWA
jgi:hypothetical protein